MKNILKRMSLLTILSFIILIVSACNNSNSIVGTWVYENNNDTYYTFNKDNTGSYTYSNNTQKFTYEDRGTKVVITFDGNTESSEFDYSIDNDILTIKDSTGSNIIYKRK